jgi:clathrin heavy chain
VATALPECTDPDDVSITVKVFLSADLLIELIELLEKIIIEPSPFSDNKNLQNLLLLTAIRADKAKVVGYINKLQNYDAGEIAKIATEHGLYEEALTIYKKYDQHAMAINFLVEHIVSIDRGLEYATKVNRPEVWGRLAKAQLDGLRIKDAIGEVFHIPSQTNLTCSFLQTHTSRQRTVRTSQRSSRYLVTQANMTTLYDSSKWHASRSASRRSIQN